VYILLFALLLVAPAHAHVGDRIYPIPEIIDEDLDRFDLHDTSLDDWRRILLQPSLWAADFYASPKVGEGAPYDPFDMDYQFWLGWNGSTDRLYLAMERIDDVYVYEYAGGNTGDLWRHDGSFEFLIDGDHSGGDYTGSADPDWTDEEKTLNNNRTAQQYTVIAQAPDGRHLGYQGAGTEWVLAPPYTDGGGGTIELSLDFFGDFGTDFGRGIFTQPGQLPSIEETPVLSILEGYVTPFDNLIWNSPEDSEISDLAPDKIIGLSISIPDFDTKPAAYRAFHSLTGAYDTWRYASNFSDARLVPARDRTSVESRSWALIKAAFKGE
jgi:hypothetical protein